MLHEPGDDDHNSHGYLLGITNQTTYKRLKQLTKTGGFSHSFAYTVFVSIVSASPLDNARMVDKVLDESSQMSSLFICLCPLVGAGILGLACGLPFRKGLISVWEALIAALSYSWWAFRDDAL